MVDSIDLENTHVCNCYIEPRNAQRDFSLFRERGGVLGAYLNGYAIIPLEEYQKLTGRDYTDMILKAEITRARR